MRTISFLILRNAADRKRAHLLVWSIQGYSWHPIHWEKNAHPQKCTRLMSSLFIQYSYLFSIVSFRSYTQNWAKQLNWGNFSPCNFAATTHVIMNGFTFEWMKRHEWKRKTTVFYSGNNETVDTSELRSKNKTITSNYYLHKLPIFMRWRLKKVCWANEVVRPDFNPVFSSNLCTSHEHHIQSHVLLKRVIEWVKK